LLVESPQPPIQPPGRPLEKAAAQLRMAFEDSAGLRIASRWRPLGSGALSAVGVGAPSEPSGLCHIWWATCAHVCDGFPVPDDLATLAASAIIAFAYKNTAAIRPVELRPYHPSDVTARFRPLDCG
jgi:hypothetical protein